MKNKSTIDTPSVDTEKECECAANLIECLNCANNAHDIEHCGILGKPFGWNCAKCGVIGHAADKNGNYICPPPDKVSDQSQDDYQNAVVDIAEGWGDDKMHEYIQKLLHQARIERTREIKEMIEKRMNQLNFDPIELYTPIAVKYILSDVLEKI